MSFPDLPHSVSFPWTELAERVAAAGAAPWTPHGNGRWYEQHDEDGSLRCALRPPLVLLPDGGLPAMHALLARAQCGPGRYGILLFQAGAASMGLFHDDAMLEHKAIKRYVVRGKGRAQPTHLKTRGKSRFGSRLRLRNAQMLLDDVAERLRGWWRQVPEPGTLFLSCPVRLFADLCRMDPPPPVTPNDPRVVRVPIDVNVPRHAELIRVNRSISRARLYTSEPPADSEGEVLPEAG